MGCCASTGRNAAETPPSSLAGDVSKSPPTAEEEAVKEVLSETPRKPLSPNPYLYPSIPQPSNNGFPMMTSSLDPPHRKVLHSPRKQIGGFNPTPRDEISDASDGVHADVRRRVPRSPSPGRRERLAGKSPVKRSDPAPRRSGSGRVLVERRRDPGENSGRRSGSPVARNVGRSLSGRRASPGKMRMGQPEGGPGERWEMNPTAPDESLENPLVSLECFIFL